MSAPSAESKAICDAVKATLPTPAEVVALRARTYVVPPVPLRPKLEIRPGLVLFVNRHGEFYKSSSFPLAAAVLNATTSAMECLLDYARRTFGEGTSVLHVPNTDVPGITFVDCFMGGSSFHFYDRSVRHMLDNHRDKLTRKLDVDRIDAAAAIIYFWTRTRPAAETWARVLTTNDFDIVGVPDVTEIVTACPEAYRVTVPEFVSVVPDDDDDNNDITVPPATGTLHMLCVPIARTGYDDDDNQSPNLLEDDDDDEDDESPLEIGVWFPNEYTQSDRDTRPTLPFIAANIPYADVANETQYDTLMGPIDKVVGTLKPGYGVNDMMEPNDIHEDVPSNDPRVHIRVVDLTGRSVPAGPNGRRNPIVELVGSA
jgi:hypothetical protein